LNSYLNDRPLNERATLENIAKAVNENLDKHRPSYNLNEIEQYLKTGSENDLFLYADGEIIQ